MPVRRAENGGCARPRELGAHASYDISAVAPRGSIRFVQVQVCDAMVGNSCAFTSRAKCFGHAEGDIYLPVTATAQPPKDVLCQVETTGRADV